MLEAIGLEEGDANDEARPKSMLKYGNLLTL